MRSIHWRIGTRIDRVAAALALAVDHLLVREHRAERRAPVDRHLGLVGEAALVELLEDPLRPAHVAGVGGVDLARPVVGEAERLELAPVDVDVAPGGLARVGAGLDRVLLGGQAEGVPAHRVQHVEAAHALVARDRVGADVALRDGRRGGPRRTGRGTCRARRTSGVRGSSSARKVPCSAQCALPARLDRRGFVGHGPTVPTPAPVVNAAAPPVASRAWRRRGRASEPPRDLRRLRRHRRDGGRRGARRDEPVPDALAAAHLRRDAHARPARARPRARRRVGRAGRLHPGRGGPRARAARGRRAARRPDRGPARPADLGGGGAQRARAPAPRRRAPRLRRRRAAARRGGRVRGAPRRRRQPAHALPGGPRADRRLAHLEDAARHVPRAPRLQDRQRAARAGHGARRRSCSTSTRARCSGWSPRPATLRRGAPLAHARAAGAALDGLRRPRGGRRPSSQRARRLFRERGWRVVDITNRAVEENAARIIELYEEGEAPARAERPSRARARQVHARLALSWSVECVLLPLA